MARSSRAPRSVEEGRPGKAPAELSFRRHRWTQRLFEYAVVAVLILVLLAVFLERTETLGAQAEQLAMRGVLRSLRTAVLLASIHPGQSGSGAWRELQQGGNPMALLKRPPENYLGELTVFSENLLPGGVWFYDRTHRELVYHVAHRDHLDTTVPGTSLIRFRLEREPFEKEGGRVLFKLTSRYSYAWKSP